MENLTAVLLTFMTGLAIGIAGTALLLPARRQRKQFEQERDEALAALTRHREEVDNHFLRTAELVNQMTASYRAVHDHLSDGARTLCSEQGRRLAMAKSLDSLPGYPGEQSSDATAPVAQPLDYAPAAQGTLSEDFGLRLEADGPFSPLDDLQTPDIPDKVDVAQPRDYAEGCEDQGCSTADGRRP